MSRAVTLATRGAGRVSPNPPVGCVIARGEEEVGAGWHERCGGPHAEVQALAAAGAAARGATAYVTLMPCAHTGRTPPCAQALIAAGVARVVAARDDPNPVSGDSQRELEAAGVSVAVGLLAAEAGYGMRGYLKQLATGLPLVTLKYAMTLDGKVATRCGHSQWISSEESRARVQEMRAQHDAILVGIGTVLADDSRLTVRDRSRPQPRRVIVDSGCRLSPAARVLQEEGGEVIVLTTASAPVDNIRAVEKAGASVICVEPEERSASAPGVDLRLALQELAGLGVRLVLCEAGPRILGSLFDGGLVDEVIAFIAPKIVGGSDAPAPVGGKGVASLDEAISLNDLSLMACGPDVCLRGRVGDWPWLGSAK